MLGATSKILSAFVETASGCSINPGVSIRRELFFLSDNQITARGLFASAEEVEKQEEETRKKHFAYIDEENQLEQFKKMGYALPNNIRQKPVNVFDPNFDFEL